MHAPPHTYEDIAVRLEKPQALLYKLSLSITKDPSNALTPQTLSPSVIVLQNDNRSPGTADFSIELTPLAGSGAPRLAVLDPQIVNE
jgi:hypothetical protein